MNKTVIYSVAIVCIAALEAVALIQGINGAYLALALTTIGGIAGFVAGKKL